MVDDQDLVGQIEHEVALARRAFEAAAQRLELEREVVAEGAVEPEVRIRVGREEIDDRAQHREHRRLPAALLLREASLGHAHVAAQHARTMIERFDRGRRLERRRDRRDQQATALVERLHLDRAIARLEQQRRIHEAHVPARVAAGILVAGRQQHAALRVERGGQLREQRGAVDGVDATRDANAAAGLVGMLLGHRDSPIASSRSGPSFGKRKRPPRKRRPRMLSCERMRSRLARSGATRAGSTARRFASAAP